MSAELWYKVAVLVRDADPIEVGPIHLLVHGTENIEMALESLRNRIKSDWQQAVATGSLWDVIEDETGFIVLNTTSVVGVAVTVVEQPETAEPEQASAPDQPAGGTVTHVEINQPVAA